MRELHCFDHVAGDLWILPRHLMRKPHRGWTIGSSGGDENLKMYGRHDFKHRFFAGT
jgi:hypothetical protein